MALVKYLKGVQLLIEVSDMGGTPVFAHPCLINANRQLSITAEMNDVVVPDCADPDLMAWTVREKRALSATITGAGVLHTPDVEEYFDWVTSSAAKDVRAKLNGVTALNGGGHVAGSFHLSQFDFGGDRGGLTECNISLPSTGALSWVAAT